LKKFFIIAVLSLSLAGCATFQKLGQDISNVVGIVTSAKVTPQQILVVANAYDAVEATATQYLLYCHVNPAIPQCALKTRKLVVADVRAGRAARNALEPYVISGGAGPSDIYNTLVATITAIKNDTPSVSQ